MIDIRRRTISDISSVSVDGGMSVDPRENNYDSSESDSDRVDIEASVLTHNAHVCKIFVHSNHLSYWVLAGTNKILY